MATDQFGYELTEEERFRLMMEQQRAGLTPLLPGSSATQMLGGPAVDTFIDRPRIAPIQQPRYDSTTPTLGPIQMASSTPTWNTDATSGVPSMLGGSFQATPAHFAASQDVENLAAAGDISAQEADFSKARNLIETGFSTPLAAAGAYPYQIGQEVLRDVRNQGISGIGSGLKRGAQAGWDNLRGIGAGIYDRINRTDPNLQGDTPTSMAQVGGIPSGDRFDLAQPNWRDQAVAEAQALYGSGSTNDEMDLIDAWKDTTPGYSLSATLRDIVQPSGYEARRMMGIEDSGDSLAVSPQTDQDYLDLGVTPPGWDIAHPSQSPLLDQRYLEQPDKQTVTQDVTQAATGTTGLGTTGGGTTAGGLPSDFLSGTVFPALTGEPFGPYDEQQKTVEDWVGLSRQPGTPFTGMLSDWDAGVMKGHQLATVGAVPGSYTNTLGGGLANTVFSGLQPLDQVVDEWGTANPFASALRGAIGGTANLAGQMFGPPDTPVTAAYELMNQGVRPASHFAVDEQGVMSPALREMVTQVDEFSPLASPTITAQDQINAYNAASMGAIASHPGQGGHIGGPTDPDITIPEMLARQDERQQAMPTQSDLAGITQQNVINAQMVQEATNRQRQEQAAIDAHIAASVMAPRQDAMPAAPAGPSPAQIAAQIAAAEQSHRDQQASARQALKDFYASRDFQEGGMTAEEAGLIEEATGVDTFGSGNPFAEQGGGYQGGYADMGGFEGAR